METIVEIAVSVACKVGEWLATPVVHHCSYVIRSDRCVRELNDDVDKLEAKRVGVQGCVDRAENDMKDIKREVVRWKNDAETVTNKARGVLENDGRAKKTCFCGWLPNPKVRYCIGRDARKTAEDIQKLIQQGQFERVYNESAPMGLVDVAPRENPSASNGGHTITDSRASIFQGIMKALDDEKLKVIGIYGPGGVGKTTLLDEVEKKLRKEGRPFHMIATSKVSQNPDLKKIQDDIASALGLNLKDETSDEVRRRRLFQRLENDPTKKILIILDDLWEEIDLREVGIPSRDESRGCQVLLTSRYKDVLQKTRASPIFYLEGLKYDEALKLFEKRVGDRLKNEELKAIAAEVVKKLAGLPLLINSVASTLKYGKDSAWRIYSKKIEESKIETIVKLSYDHLDREETKSLFLLCGLIGGTINVDLLLGLGMGLGLFEVFDGMMKESRDRLNVMLQSLCSACLLVDGGDDEHNVTIHDLYSEVVISTPFRGQYSLRMNSNYGSWPKEKLEKCWGICLVNVVGDRLVELMQGGCPALKILMLSQPDFVGMPSHRHDVGNCCRLDFAHKKELRVLYLHSMHIPILPPSIQILENLRSLYLNKCNVEDVKILGELEALQILSFAGSSISSLPKEIGKLTNLKLLNLSKCCRLNHIEHGVFKGLINLEELYLRESFSGWMSEATLLSESCNARLAELKNLTKLTTLEISIPNPTLLLQDGDLPFGNLIKFWINIGNATMVKFEGLTSMALNLGGRDDILSNEWVQKTLQKTQYLCSDGLREFKKKSAHELCSQGFPKLKHLDIRNCSSIEHIVSSSNGAFPLLESLHLQNLSNLENIYDGPECFSRLKVIKVTQCDRLEYLWCLSQMHDFTQLEEIEVCCCDSIRAIVIDDERKETVVADNRIELPNLRRLELAKLPKMTSFCVEAGITSDGAPIQVWFPRLESLVMEGLLDLEKILYGQPPLACSNLKSIEIRESKSTSSILISDWILKLPNLESLKVESSPSAEVVFDLEEIKGTGHVEILSRLATLWLSDLPNLRRMCKENAQLRGLSIFQNLKELEVANIGLAFLFPVSVAKCLREITKIAVSGCEKMEALVVDEDGRDEGINDIIEFRLLKRLSINNCPMIKSFSYFHGKKESVPITSDSQDTYSDFFFDPKVSLPSLEQLHFHSVRSFKSIWPLELPQSSFDNFAKLEVFECSELLNVFSSTITGLGCPSLEIELECGPLDSNTTEQTGVVPVSEATRLSHVVKSNSQTILGLPNLEYVKVEKCSKLRYLFPYAVATTLEKLKSLHIKNCEQIKEVVAKEGGGQSKADVLIFPFLTSLSIFQCPNFRAFIANPTSVERPSGEMAKENDKLQQPLFNEMVTFPTLDKVKIGGVRVKELWSNQIRDASFCKLRYLELMDCENLQSITPSHMWKRLQRSLKILEVKSCRSIEIIYEGNATVAETGKLSRLVLHDLENLTHIWRYDSLFNINVPFPNLMDIEVVRCRRLRMLFETFTASLLGQIRWLQVESCDDMELIADHGECEGATCTTITFSELEALQLKELPRFRGYLPEKYHVEFRSPRALIRVGCGKEPDHSDVVSDLFGWELYRFWHRVIAEEIAEMMKG